MSDAIIRIYKEYIGKYEKLKAESKNAGVIAQCELEIKLMSDHVRRLETNHAECVESCCPGCTLGGLKGESSDDQERTQADGHG